MGEPVGSQSVIAGQSRPGRHRFRSAYDPASPCTRKTSCAETMDARVKPAHDEIELGAQRLRRVVRLLAVEHALQRIEVPLRRGRAL